MKKLTLQEKQNSADALLKRINALHKPGETVRLMEVCGTHTGLLYTADAADDLLCVGLGGRRKIKKQNNILKCLHNRMIQNVYIRVTTNLSK